MSEFFEMLGCLFYALMLFAIAGSVIAFWAWVVSLLC